MVCEGAEIGRDMRGFQHILHCAPGNSTAPTVGFHQRRPKGRLAPPQSNGSDSALSLVVNTVWVEFGIVCFVATYRRQRSEERREDLLQFEHYVIGHPVPARLGR